MSTLAPASLALRDGHKIPQLGFGVWQVADDEAETAVAEAFRAGYRSIDTAAIYANERGVGRALKASGLSRDEVFITTKLWNTDQGRDQTLRAFDVSLEKLGLETVDLYLIHWPSPRRGLFLDSWKALVELKKQGRARSIGVSNFQVEHLQKIIDETGEIPVVNQIELHPRFQQQELRQLHAAHGIVTESWSPLGQGQSLSEPALVSIAQKHGKTPAQVVLRWHIQNGFIVIPKSVTPARIAENFRVFDFELDTDDLQAIRGLDTDAGRIGPNPLTADF